MWTEAVLPEIAACNRTAHAREHGMRQKGGGLLKTEMTARCQRERLLHKTRPGIGALREIRFYLDLS